jgi:uncharacterized protein YjbI with pentapeptide repeats
MGQLFDFLIWIYTAIFNFINKYIVTTFVLLSFLAFFAISHFAAEYFSLQSLYNDYYDDKRETSQQILLGFVSIFSVLPIFVLYAKSVTKAKDYLSKQLDAAIANLGSQSNETRNAAVENILDIAKTASELLEKAFNALCSHLIQQSNKEYKDFIAKYHNLSIEKINANFSSSKEIQDLINIIFKRKDSVKIFETLPANLSDGKFFGLNFENISIKNFIYNNTFFVRCNINGVSFSFTDFNHCFFNDSKISNSLFSACSFNAVQIEKCSFYYASFIGCSFNYDSVISKCEFSTGCKLEKNSFNKTNLIEINFFGMNLKDANFTYSSLLGCSFSIGAKLEGLELKKTVLQMCRFNYSTIMSLTAGLDTEINGCSFDDASLEQCDFIKARLVDTNFFYSNLDYIFFGIPKNYLRKLFSAQTKASNIIIVVPKDADKDQDSNVFKHITLEEYKSILKSKAEKERKRQKKNS